MIKKIYLYLIKNKILFFSFFTFFIIRLPYLEKFNLLHDERDIVLSGYKIAKTGYDLNNNFLPLNFTNIHPKTPFLSIYYSALWWFFFPFKSIFFARLPFVFISSFLIFAVFELIKTITKNKKIAFLTSLIFCFSPWIFHISRLALEINIALPLTIFGINLYLKEKKFLSFFLFTLVFFIYQGFRPLLPIVILYCEFFLILQKKRKLSTIIFSLIIILFFFLAIISLSFLIDGTTTSKRLNEIIFLNLNKFSDEVIFKRNTSIAPDLIKKILYNKVTSGFDYILTGFIKGQDLIYLFKEGDYSPINANVAGGQFFYPMIFFYYLGFFYLGKRNKINFYYPLGFILIGMIPSLINSLSLTFSIRSSLTAISFSYILSLGMIFFSDITASLKLICKIPLFIFLIGTFFINIIYFYFNYFYRRPITVGELFFENERQLALYLINNKNNKNKIYIFHKFPNEIYLTYCFLNNDVDIKKVKADFLNYRDLKINNIYFYNCDRKKNYFDYKNSVIFEGCLNKKEYEKFLYRMRSYRIPYRDFSEKMAYFILEN